jgi:TBCC domain-containing protein 1
MLEEVDAQNFTSAVSVNRDAPLQEMQVDVRCFAIFIAMQLYSQHSRDNETSKIEAQDGWGQKADMPAHMSSPRQKAKSQQQSSKFAMIMHFIKNNLKLFLRLVSTDIHNSEVSLTANEFNSLRVLFKPHQIQGTTLSRSLASLTPFFASGATHSTKVHMSDLADWLLQNVESDDLSKRQDSLQITYLNKCVAIKGEEMHSLMDVRISNCEESYIYINQAVDCLLVQECSSCTVFCASVRRVCSIKDCESTNVTVASSCIRIGNAVDCSVHGYSHMGGPIVYGDTRSLLLGPHNACYPDMLNHLSTASINIQVPDINNRLSNFSQPQLMHVPKQSINFQQALEFMRLSLPKQFGKEDKLRLCPQEPFLNVLNMRLAKFAEFQKQIKMRNLSPEQEKMLHVAIQGYFREWFTQTSNYKQITELVKMMDLEY